MSTLQFAWVMYFLGAAGCSLVAWWMFGWAVRFVRYSAVATTLVLLLVPFTVDKELGTLAPALFAVVFEGMAQGAAAMERPLKLLISVWVMVEIIIGLFVFLTRKSYLEKQQANLAMDQQNLNDSQSGQLNEGQMGSTFVVDTEHEAHDEFDAELEPQPMLSLDEQVLDEILAEQKPKIRKKPSVDRPSGKKPASGSSDNPSSAAKTSPPNESNLAKVTKARSTKAETIRAIRD